MSILEQTAPPASCTAENLRKEIDRLIAAGAHVEACRCLAQVWTEEAGLSAAAFIVSRYEKLQASLPLVPARVFFLRSFTVESVLPLVRAAAFVGGIKITAEVGDFNAYAQEILNPASGLYRFAPDVVILAVQTRDVAPDLWERFCDLSAPEVRSAVERVVGQFRTWVRTFRSHSQAYLILHTLEAPPYPSEGVLGSQTTTGQAEIIREINQELRRMADEESGVYLLDYDGLVGRYGRIHWHNERKWLTARMPIETNHLRPLAEEWMRFLHPLLGKICKVLVADLDNTLWGGIVGEDGFEKIQVGPDYPGAAYQAVQRVMLDFHRRGIMLAVCSKNNVGEAMEILEKHPGMCLRPEHFSALRINWNDKAQNLREIAAELNVGVESLAFLDDNPVERMRIRTELPEVTVIDLPSDPLGFAHALRASPVFERVVLSAEDRERGRYYAEQRQRIELQSRASSVEEFFRSLQQEVEVARVTPYTLMRVAQLTQKTNQFNLTTRRYSQQQINELAASTCTRVYSVRVKDRFGDNGLVGVMITRDDGDLSEIDTFLLSCRVIGRTVETALLSFLVDKARTQGKKQLQGWFLPTKKNGPAREFYPTHKFRCLREEEGGTCWGLDMADADIVCPEWITLTAVDGMLAP